MSKKTTEKFCFIIGPIGARLSDVYESALFRMEQIIEPAATTNNYYTRRADQDNRIGSITTKMILDIYNADLIVVDLWPVSENLPNTNVMYELGIAHAFDKPTICLKKENLALPFDIGDLRAVEWDGNYSSSEHVRTRLTKMIEDINNTSNPFGPIANILNLQMSVNNIPNENPDKNAISLLEQRLLSIESKMSSFDFNQLNPNDIKNIIYKKLVDLAKELDININTNDLMIYAINVSAISPKHAVTKIVNSLNNIGSTNDFIKNYINAYDNYKGLNWSTKEYLSTLKYYEPELIQQYDMIEAAKKRSK